ncbi:STAS domain-containing protein [Streptomyces sp. NPDC001530]|uniref:STAS domain-containing protein n=1 Tax=Streptomyces sp. NPDC001530 TaxID=3364582 RepID=UPI00368822D2
MSKTQIQSAPLLRERAVGRAVVVELYGEIDILTAAPISARLDVLTTAPQPELVLDLRGVTFIDCRGLALLCRARTRALNQGGRLRLVTSSPRILCLLRRTHLGQAFDVHPGLLEALSAVTDGGAPTRITDTEAFAVPLR